MGKRVTLTKAHAASAFGRSLIAFFHAAAEDRELSLEDVKQLAALLRAAPPDIPAAEFLRELTTEILRDGVVDDLEAYQLRLAIERVVPLAERASIKSKLSDIQRPVVARLQPDAEDDDDVDIDEEPATERQLAFIKTLGGAPLPGLTKWAASDLINELKKRSPPSPRQMMVLRFWSRLDLACLSRAQISVWLDRFYAEDDRRLPAWEMFKAEHGDDGAQRDPSWVPIGAGRHYYARAAALSTDASGRPKDPADSLRQVNPVLVVLVVLLSLAVLGLLIALLAIR